MGLNGIKTMAALGFLLKTNGFLDLRLWPKALLVFLDSVVCKNPAGIF